ncbi:MAG: VWA domain-containing protein [Actinobacteria bacterium]|nr:VWA domain-containing protein [Actinomycetota bacterium]
MTTSTAPSRLAVGFATALRRSGLAVSPDSVVAFAEALTAVGLEQRTGVYWAGRATLVRAPEHIAAYDAAFDRFWLGTPSAPGEATSPPPPPPALDTDEDIDDEPGSPAARPAMVVRYSAREVLRHKDFAACSSDELADARRLMADMRVAGALRRSRRLVPSKRRSGQPDVRATVRAALTTGGELVRRPRKAPSRRPRRVVLLCDVSGSMDPYARALVRFLNAAVAGRQRVEAFAVGTRLTRLTRELATRDPDVALDAAARAVADWSGGTRLGEGLQRFNDEWGIRGMARGAVVVVLSDGWDRGDPAVLARELARLRRVAHRIVWVNPLKASPGFAPLAGGMAAALPHVDALVEGHSLAALEHLAAVIAR